MRLQLETNPKNRAAPSSSNSGSLLTVEIMITRLSCWNVGDYERTMVTAPTWPCQFSVTLTSTPPWFFLSSCLILVHCWRYGVITPIWLGSIYDSASETIAKIVGKLTQSPTTIIQQCRNVSIDNRCLFNVKERRWFRFSQVFAYKKVQVSVNIRYIMLNSWITADVVEDNWKALFWKLREPYEAVDKYRVRAIF